MIAPRTLRFSWLATVSLAVTMLVVTTSAQAVQYQARADFLRETLGSEKPPSAVVWMNDELRQIATEVLGHKPVTLRTRYWYNETRTVWILDEIGKEKPITLGIVIEGQAIKLLRVLEFRESRGWEISYPFFADQFEGIGLHRSGKLSGRIDGISGATLSVNAATRSARFALILDQYATRNTKARASAP